MYREGGDLKGRNEQFRQGVKSQGGNVHVHFGGDLPPNLEEVICDHYYWSVRYFAKTHLSQTHG